MRLALLLAAWPIASVVTALLLGRFLAHAQPQHQRGDDLGDAFRFPHEGSTNV